MKLFTILLALLVFPHTSNAVDTQSASNAVDTQSGRALLKDCNVIVNAIDKKDMSGDPAGAALCLGWIRGIIDAGNILEVYAKAKNHPPPNMYCVPHGVTDEQGIRAVVKFLEDNPEKLHEYGSPLVTAALAKAFPCK